VRNEPLTQQLVEDRILKLCDALESNLDTFRELAASRADAEANYKHRYSRSLVEQHGKVTVSVREAVAHLKATGDYREWRTLEAQERATQQLLTSIRAQLDALRTIAANVRYAGGHQ
jgi:hypothetical protein